MWRLNSEPNIARFYGYADNPSTILMKMYTRGSLERFITEIDGSLDTKQKMHFARGIAAGIAAIHKLGFAHCDIKVKSSFLFHVQPVNILLEESSDGLLSPVITDFGIAKMLSTRQASVAAFKPIHLKAASFRYAAPEILRAIQGDQADWSYVHRPDVLLKGDVFSYAMVLYAIQLLKLPWAKSNAKEIITFVLENQRPPISFAGNKPEKQIADIMRACWAQDPLARPTAEQVYRRLMMAE